MHKNSQDSENIIISKTFLWFLCIFYSMGCIQQVFINLHTQPCPTVYPNILLNLLDRMAYMG
jgi:hypothetical protein